MKEELPIPFCAGNRTWGDPGLEPQPFQCDPDFVASELVKFGVAHNSAFAYLPPAHLKLRFYQNDNLTVRL
jgi:hypothetical protein